MNNKGFIATSLIYSFFLVFITLFLTIIADYLQDKVLLNTIEDSIKQELSEGISLDKLNGKNVVFQGNFGDLFAGYNVSVDGTKKYAVTVSGNNMILSYNANNISIEVASNTKFIKEPSDNSDENNRVITITGVKEIAS